MSFEDFKFNKRSAGLEKGYLKEYIRDRKGIKFIFKNKKKLKDSLNDTENSGTVLKNM